MRLLSLYIMGGFGHIKPAQAIVEQFKRAGLPGESYDVFSVDGQPNYDSANFYNAVTRSALLLPLWNLITRHDLIPAWFFQPIHLFEVLCNQSAIKRLRALGSTNPDLIITATHFFAALLASQALPQKTIFLYVTDIHPHGLWKISSPNIHYLVPMEETKIDIMRHGIDSKRITIVGFPIHREITNHVRDRHLRRLRRFGPHNSETIEILIMSGGAGTGGHEMKQLIHQLSSRLKSHRIRLTFLISTPNLAQQLLALFASRQSLGYPVSIKQYTPESFYPALTRADILITKAGGDITFEALAEGIPIYTLKDVGDHERLNRQYLELIGASKPLSLHQDHSWELIQSDLFSGDIILMAKAAYEHGTFHRRADIVSTIKTILKGE